MTLKYASLMSPNASFAPALYVRFAISVAGS